MQLVFDIGGSNIRIAATENGREFMAEPVIAETPDSFEEGMKTIASLKEQVVGGAALDAAAGGVAGRLDKDRAVLLRSPNLPDWVDKPLAERLKEIFNAPVSLENDAAVVGLGEANFGAGKGAGIVAYITVSTGVGGARIVDGAIDRNTFGFEPGHQIIDIDGTECPSCNAPGVHGDGPGHLEGYVSGAATQKRFGVKPYQVTDPHAWSELARWLAYGLNNTILHWSPDVVVLGGPMIVGDPAIDIHAVRRNLDEILDIFPEKPDIEPATLGDIGGLYGAMALLGREGE